MHYEIEVGSDVVEGKHHEDGSPIEVLKFFVAATEADGRRFVHSYVFTTEAEASQLAQRVQAAQDAGGWAGPGNEHWVEVQPAYGSEAYAACWRDYARDDSEVEFPAH